MLSNRLISGLYGIRKTILAFLFVGSSGMAVGSGHPEVCKNAVKMLYKSLPVEYLEKVSHIVSPDDQLFQRIAGQDVVLRPVNWDHLNLKISRQHQDVTQIRCPVPVGWQADFHRTSRLTPVSGQTVELSEQVGGGFWSKAGTYHLSSGVIWYQDRGKFGMIPLWFSGETEESNDDFDRELKAALKFPDQVEIRTKAPRTKQERLLRFGVSLTGEVGPEYWFDLSQRQEVIWTDLLKASRDFLGFPLSDWVLGIDPGYNFLSYPLLSKNGRQLANYDRSRAYSYFKNIFDQSSLQPVWIWMLVRSSAGEEEMRQFKFTRDMPDQQSGSLTFQALNRD